MSTVIHRDTDTNDPKPSPTTPVVVMLGLFTTCQCWVSAVTVENTDVVWLDLITRSGHRTTPLGVINGIDARDPRLTLESFHRHWADTPEIRWHLLRQAGLLYRTYLTDRTHPRPEGSRA